MKRLIALILMCALLLTACRQTEETEVKPLVNDYYGSVLRISSLIDDVNAVIDERLGRAEQVMYENPSDYWGRDGFLRFPREMFDLTLLNCVGYLNETQTAWDEAVSLATKAFVDSKLASAKESVGIIRRAANDYYITLDGIGNSAWLNSYNARAYRYIDVKYDANHDWSQMLESVYYSGIPVTCNDKMFEYARLSDGGYALQTETERLVARYHGSVLVSFVYTRLNGDRFEKYDAYRTEHVAVENGVESIIVPDEIENATPYTLDGNIKSQYNPCDSMFKSIADVTDVWVYEYDDCIDTYIDYRDGVLNLGFRNALSGLPEGYTIDTDGKVVRDE